MERRKYLILAVCSVLLSACSGNKGDKNTDIIKVEAMQCGDGTMTADARTYVGEVEAELATAVSFTGSGTVTRVFVNEGQRVRKGQLIAQLDPTQYKNALMSAQAMMTQAQDAYDRMKLLHNQHSISDMDWVEVQSKVQQARSSLQMAQKAVKDCSLTAPCSGVVGNKNMEAGMTALPAQPVCTILNINKVKVKISVPEKEIGSFSQAMLKDDGGVVISVAALGKTFYPHTIEKGVQADALSRTYDVKFCVSNPAGDLLPGMVADVRLGTGSTTGGQAGFYLPVRCVQQSAKGKYFVWVIKNGKSHRQEVTLGEVSGNSINIVSGLSKGDMVITSGYQKVSEGSSVKQ